jgi:Domain of unknown function (DUF4398)
MRRVSKYENMLLSVAVVATAIAAGCASVPLRTESSTSGIRAAEEVGARKVPQAALHLQLAKEELQKAKNLAADGKEEMANSMLQRAEADAELAVMLSREHAEQAEARAAMKRVRELRTDNEQAVEGNTP